MMRSPCLITPQIQAQDPWKRAYGGILAAKTWALDGQNPRSLEKVNDVADFGWAIAIITAIYGVVSGPRLTLKKKLPLMRNRLRPFLQ